MNENELREALDAVRAEVSARYPNRLLVDDVAVRAAMEAARAALVGPR